MPRYNYETLKTSQMREYAKELEREAARLRATAEQLEEDGYKTASVRNQTIAVIGLEYVIKFCDAVREAHVSKKVDQEKYTWREKATSRGKKR